MYMCVISHVLSGYMYIYMHGGMIISYVVGWLVTCTYILSEYVLMFVYFDVSKMILCDQRFVINDL